MPKRAKQSSNRPASPIVVVERRPEERRQARRYTTRIEVDYASEDTFLFAYITDVSTLGIFVSTEEPELPGTQLRLRFTPPGDDRRLELRGTVIWINPPRAGDWHGRTTGMGVQFYDLTAEQRERLVHLVGRLAYLDREENEPTLFS